MTAINGTNLPATALSYRSTTTAATSGANPPGKLWLPIWSGEVINAYDEYNVFEGLVEQRTISSGTTVEIPITGTVDLNPAWDAGEELVGKGNNTATTFQIKLDKRPMASHFEIDNVDLMLTQWEFRSELARQAAMQLANTRDKQIFSYLTRAALSNPFANDPRSSISTAKLDTMLYGNDAGDDDKCLNLLGDATASQANRATAALSALEAIEKYIVDAQELDIPYDQLYFAVTPQAFMDIRALGVARSAADLSHNNAAGSVGNGAMFAGNSVGSLGGPLANGYKNIHDTLEYMGCTIIKSNHVLQDDLSAAGSTDGTDLGELKYGMDFATGEMKGLIFMPQAVAAIRLQGLKVDTVDDVRRNTTFTVASMMAGTGVLRPECAAVVTGLRLGSGSADSVLNDRSDVASSKFDVPAE
jgi:hypothetical protein